MDRTAAAENTGEMKTRGHQILPLNLGSNGRAVADRSSVCSVAMACILGFVHLLGCGPLN